MFLRRLNYNLQERDTIDYFLVQILTEPEPTFRGMQFRQPTRKGTSTTRSLFAERIGWSSVSSGPL